MASTDFRHPPDASHLWRDAAPHPCLETLSGAISVAGVLIPHPTRLNGFDFGTSNTESVTGAESLSQQVTKSPRIFRALTWPVA
jgi:hypothetical protein